MKIFLDSAVIDEIKEVSDLGLLDGVTTNPSLVAKINMNYEELVTKICSLTSSPVSAEVLATTSNDMLTEAKRLRECGENVVVKIPLTKEGFKALYLCAQENIPTNATLCFSATQALLAAKVGANYISPFMGRFDDIGTCGVELISEISEIFSNYDFSTQVIAASIRSNLHVKEVALSGCDIATIPYKIFTQLFKHPLTDIGIAKFMSDAKNITQPIAAN